MLVYHRVQALTVSYPMGTHCRTLYYFIARSNSPTSVAPFYTGLRWPRSTKSRCVSLICHVGLDLVCLSFVLSCIQCVLSFQALEEYILERPEVALVLSCSPFTIMIYQTRQMPGLPTRLRRRHNTLGGRQDTLGRQHVIHVFSS